MVGAPLTAERQSPNSSIDLRPTLSTHGMANRRFCLRMEPLDNVLPSLVVYLDGSRPECATHQWMYSATLDSRSRVELSHTLMHRLWETPYPRSVSRTRAQPTMSQSSTCGFSDRVKSS